ncbi:MAG: HAD-IB family hydrolase [Actinomycetota bacterium]
MKRIAVFDFDGTIIKEDSMLVFFFRYFKFSLKNIPVFFKILFETIKYFIKLEPHTSFKQKYVNTAINYSRIEDKNALALDFSDYLLTRVSPQAVKWMEKLRENGYELLLLSASIDLYLNKVYQSLGFDNLICTEIYEKEGKVGIIKNCFGKNKIEMLLQYYGDETIDWENSYCFSDGPTDKELLELFGNPYIINNRKFYKKNPGFNFQKWH